MVGAAIGRYRPHITETSGRTHGTRDRFFGSSNITPNQGCIIWALGPKAKHEIMRGQWGRELKDIPLQELLKLFKKTFLPTRNLFHSRAQFFNIKQEDNETLDEYWKKLVDTQTEV